MKKIEFRGKEYKSLDDFFLKNKEIVPFKSSLSLRNRLKEGLSLEEAIEKGKKKRGNSNGKVKFRGEEYNSVEDFFFKNREIIPFKSSLSLRNRLKEGLSLEKIITEGKRKPGSTEGKLGPYLVEGVTYTSLPSIAKEYGITERAIYKRYSRGKRGDDLVPEKKRKNYIKPERKYKLYVNGVGYNSVADLCRKNGVKYITYRMRLRHGWSQEEALGIKMRKNIHQNSLFNKKYNGKRRKIGKEVIIDGRKFNSIAEASNFYKRDPEAVRTQILKGRTLREALGLDLADTNYVISYKGKKYKSLPILTKSLGLSYNLIASRINNMGLSFEEAIKLGSDRISNEGRYNKKIFDKNPDLANSNGYLYFVSINIDNKKRYKIGITKTTAEKRLTQAGYEFSVIKTFSSTLLKCYLMEQALKERFKQFKDKKIEAKHLDGHTEIFDLPNNLVNLIKDLIK